MNLGRLVGATVAAAVLAACSGTSGQDEARAAVKHYLAQVAVAYRTSDVSPVDPLVGDEVGRRLLGLIGVKRDMGVALDARLLELEFTGVRVEAELLVAETRERWYYADRKLGTGEQVGPDSIDAYAMRYRFSRQQGRVVLEDLEFIAEPVVGRRTGPVELDARVLHGLPAAAPPGHPAERTP
jgi:hypothetical protein